MRGPGPFPSRRGSAVSGSAGGSESTDRGLAGGCGSASRGSAGGGGSAGGRGSACHRFAGALGSAGGRGSTGRGSAGRCRVPPLSLLSQKSLLPLLLLLLALALCPLGSRAAFPASARGDHQCAAGGSAGRAAPAVRCAGGNTAGGLGTPGGAGKVPGGWRTGGGGVGWAGCRALPGAANCLSLLSLSLLCRSGTFPFDCAVGKFLYCLVLGVGGSVLLSSRLFCVVWFRVCFFPSFCCGGTFVCLIFFVCLVFCFLFSFARSSSTLSLFFFSIFHSQTLLAPISSFIPFFSIHLLHVTTFSRRIAQRAVCVCLGRRSWREHLQQFRAAGTRRRCRWWRPGHALSGGPWDSPGTLPRTSNTRSVSLSHTHIYIYTHTHSHNYLEV
jgi:hypothetical protein